LAYKKSDGIHENIITADLAIRSLLQSIGRELDSWQFGLKRNYGTIAFPFQLTAHKILNSNLSGKDCQVFVKLSPGYRASKR